MIRIVVVGAGISGLVAARQLADVGDVTILDASGRCGGKLASVEVDGLSPTPAPSRCWPADRKRST